jgi:hypothetical protein
MLPTLTEISQKWIDQKIWLVNNIGLNNDALHVHGGLLILCITAVLIRRRPDHPMCWIVVFLAELFNEYSDIRGEAVGEATVNAGLHDLYNTMFWPTIILMAGWLLFPKPPKLLKNDSVDLNQNSGDLPDQPLK